MQLKNRAETHNQNNNTKALEQTSTNQIYIYIYLHKKNSPHTYCTLFYVTQTHECIFLKTQQV